jgi:putative multiple sugar transport system permease protein
MQGYLLGERREVSLVKISEVTIFLLEISNDERLNRYEQHYTTPIAELFRRNIRQYGMLIALLVIMVFFQVMTKGTLLKPLNITNLILQNSYIVIMAMGMLLIIIAGHIDLSVGSVAAFTGAVAAVLIVNYDINYFVAILAALIVGGIIGAAQGCYASRDAHV